MTEAPAKAAPRKQVPPSGKLNPSEVTDARDNAPRLKDDLSGKRVRAIPAFVGQTTAVRITKQDFAEYEIDHPTVEFNFRKDQFTLPVGKPRGLTKEVAEFLVTEFPEQFEYMSS